jgi:N-methylhydantoinase A/oxoprolinase/acetone carboxylase beta subunit
MDQCGLGIDCGGTYTDGAIYDFEHRRVLASAKYPTDHHDLISSINGVLDKLPTEMLQSIQLTGLSTTLATNAIVEGRGGRACLVLIGYPDDMRVNAYGARVARVRGGHDCRGDEAQALDAEEARNAVRKHLDWADAFAVSSYFSVRNPEHEIAASRLIASETGKPIVCGHELSMHLDAPKRATTAAINARLIPLIADLIHAVRAALKARGIAAPLMMVRGDGTLMSVEMAGRRPVETILSGPAASVIGALTLTGKRDGVVVDVGGTTTDIAAVLDGVPKINESGANVGGMATQVEAIDIRTIGLGGDSFIGFALNGNIDIGPRRVIPLAMLPGPQYAMENLQTLTARKPPSPIHELLSFWKVSSTAGEEAFDESISRLAGEGVFSYNELVNEAANDVLARVRRLEQEGLLSLSALTPTDVFNAAGDFSFGDVALSTVAVEAAAALYGLSRGELIAKIKNACREARTDNLLCHLLATGDGESSLLKSWGSGRSIQGIRLSLRLENDILAVGAPAAVFLRPVAERLGCFCVEPAFMEVANAVGAVAGMVSHSEEVIIRRRQDGGYSTHASDGKYDYQDLEAATEMARIKAAALASDVARSTGAGHIELSEKIEEFTTGAWKQTVVLERRVKVRAFGRPRLETPAL